MTEGLLPRTAYADAGISTSHSPTACNSRPISNKEAKRRGYITNTNKVLTLCQREKYESVKQEFKHLIDNNELTEHALQRLMDELPADEHPHGFNLLDALQYLLVIHRAKHEVYSTKSELYRSLLSKILKYAKIDTPTPELAAAHEQALQLLEERRDKLTDPDKLAPYNEAKAIQPVRHRPLIEDSGPPHMGRGIPMRPPIQRIFEDWHATMVDKGLIEKATPAQIQKAKFVLSHIPVLKRGATQPFGIHDYRFVLDMVPANKVIVHRETVRFPTRQEIRDFTAGKKVFSNIDVLKFFWSIPSEYDGLMIHRCKGDYYHYKVVVQGDTTAPAAAHRVIMKAIGDLVAEGKALVHVDDILLATVTTEEHIILLCIVFDRLEAHGLKINHKAELCQAMVRFLGMLIHKDGVEPDLLRYNQLFLWPQPTTRAEVSKYVGFLLFFHQFIPNATVLLADLQDVANGKGRLGNDWTQEHAKAFDEAKAALINSTHLHPVDYSKDFHVHVDTATSNAIGAVLWQHDQDNVKRPILFQSRRLSPAERAYSPTDAELLGIYWSVTIAFRSFIEHSSVVIHTDHLNILDHLDLDTATSARRRRWGYYLRDFNIVDVVHEAGATFTDADTLSRVKVPLSSTPPTSTNLQAMVMTLAEASSTLHPQAPAHLLTIGHLRKEQRTDPLCRRIVQALKDPTTATKADRHLASRCETRNGIVMYRDFILRRDEGVVVPVLPASMQDEIIGLFHDASPTHNTVSHTANTLRAHWFFPEMVQKVRNYVRQCDHCTQANATGNPLRQGTLSTFQPTYHNQVLSVDIYDVSDSGGPKGEDNYRYALVGVYSFSRNPIIEPLKTKSAKEVAPLLARAWADHGVPDQLRSDQGNEFKAEVKSLCNLFGTSQIPTAKHSPQSNGAVERVNQEFQRLLRGCRLQNPDAPWQNFIPAILAQMRSSHHSSTGFSPYELTGVNPMKLGTTTPHNTSAAGFEDQPDPSQWTAWATTLQRRRETAFTNDVEARDKRLTNMNKHRTPITVSIGDWVRPINKNSNKTASQLGDQMKVTDVTRNGQAVVVQHPITGKATELPITEVVTTTSPDVTAEASTTMQTTTQGPPAAIVIVEKHTGQGHLVVSDNVSSRSENMQHKRMIYRNQRRNSAAAQARWVLTSNEAPANAKVLVRFRFQVKKGGDLTIPLWVRKAHRNVLDIQGSAWKPKK